MENQLEKKMENEMETVVIKGFIGIRVSQIQRVPFWGSLYQG